jgi:hypothetical protein
MVTPIYGVIAVIRYPSEPAFTELFVGLINVMAIVFAALTRALTMPNPDVWLGF